MADDAGSTHTRAPLLRRPRLAARRLLALLQLQLDAQLVDGALRGALELAQRARRVTLEVKVRLLWRIRIDRCLLRFLRWRGRGLVERARLGGGNLCEDRADVRVCPAGAGSP